MSRSSQFCDTQGVFGGLVFALVIAQSGTSGRMDLVQPPVAEKQAESYWLEREGDGLVYRGPKFEAHVADDGQVRFQDKGQTKALTYLPMPAPPDTATLEGTLRRWLGAKARKPAPSGTLDSPPQTLGYCPPNYPSSCDINPVRLPSHIRKEGNKWGVLVNTGVFVDWDHQLLGISTKDANRVEKARFLAATLPVRTRMAEEARDARLKSVLTDLPPLLSAIWSDSSQPARDRRKTLHELWKEVAEMPDNAPACATIIAFIRRQLPAGSPDAFTKEELDAFRAEGGPVFDPYRP